VGREVELARASSLQSRLLAPWTRLYEPRSLRKGLQGIWMPEIRLLFAMEIRTQAELGLLVPLAPTDVCIDARVQTEAR
jgi:hypothetical protein